jgi:hypothetical protein
MTFLLLEIKFHFSLMLPRFLPMQLLWSIRLKKNKNSVGLSQALNMPLDAGIIVLLK